KDSRALIMGITFKENCPDIRNTRVVDIHHELEQFGLTVDILDPWADAEEVKREYGLDILNTIDENAVYDAIDVADAHNEFLTFDYQKINRNHGVIFATKACFDRSLVAGRH